jgi:hypothetical protein
MRIPRWLAALFATSAIVFVLAAFQEFSVARTPPPDASGTPRPSEIRSYFGTIVGSAPILLDPSIQATNGFIITDVVIHAFPTSPVVVALQENGATKTVLGSDSAVVDTHFPLTSGIPIQKNAALVALVSGTAASITISGYVW